MGVVVGLLLGAGVACIWWSFWAQPAGAASSRATGWHARTQDALVQAGAAGVTPGGLVATSVMLGVVVLLLGTVLTRIPSIALCFAVFAAMGPWAVVRGRARRRRARLRPERPPDAGDAGPEQEPDDDPHQPRPRSSAARSIPVRANRSGCGG